MRDRDERENLLVKERPSKARYKLKEERIIKEKKTHIQSSYSCLRLVSVTNQRCPLS